MFWYAFITRYDESLLLYDVLSLGYRAWRMFLEIGFQGYPMFVQFAGHPLIAKLFELFDAARLIVLQVGNQGRF